MRGKPVICSDTGGLSEVVENGVTGLLFEPGNVGQLAEKIQYLMNNPDVCERMGSAGRAKALREYVPEQYYQGLMSIYESARNSIVNNTGTINTVKENDITKQTAGEDEGSVVLPTIPVNIEQKYESKAGSDTV